MSTALDRRTVMKGAAFSATLLGSGAAAAAETPALAAAPVQRSTTMTSAAFSQARLARMERVMRRHVEEGDIPGVVWAVHRNGETHFGAAGTFRLNGEGAPMARDTIFRVASIGKPITAAAAMMLVEDGVLRLDDPVDEYLPELANRKVLKSLESPLDDTVPAKRAITLRDLLTLRLGLGAIMVWPSVHPIQKAMEERGVAPGPVLFHAGSQDEFMKRIGELPLVHQPGEGWLYHTGMEVAGVLISRASGKSFGDFLKERIFEPLGMKDSAFYVPAEKQRRLPACYFRDPQTGVFSEFDPSGGTGFLSPPSFEAGGGGLVQAIDDYLVFARMLLGKGEVDGVRLLSRSSVELMTTDLISEAHKAANPFFFPEGGGWGLGMSVATKKVDVFVNPGRFGWNGGFGTSAYADPKEGLIGVLFTQRMMDSPSAPAVFTDFWNQAYAAMAD
jgi:CubicO group peptidase (beta-lactamase class C family)